MGLVERYIDDREYASYEDFKANYRLRIPENFNFSYDIIDEWARLEPDKPALLWCDDHGHEREFSFGELSRLSNQAANLYTQLGVGKGDFVLLMLKQRPEAWICILALIKIGAVCIPATFQLTPKDLEYRIQAAGVKMVMAVDEPEIVGHVDAVRDRCPTLQHVGLVGDGPIDESRYVDFRRRMLEASPQWERPTGEKATRNDDPMLIYFTSGTSGMPKMVLHDFTYPLVHIVTAKYWHRVEEGGRHLVMADSGWAKFGWGKIFGQWICGAVIVGYDNDKFSPQHTLETISRLKLTTFCAPPTIYRFFIKEDLSQYDFSTIKHCTIAGEPLNPEVFYQFKKATGLEVTEGFGQSETNVMLANYQWFPIKPGSMGKPSPLFDVDITDDEGNHLEDGVVGNVVVRNAWQHPAGLFREYYKAPEANEKSFRNGIYFTGDTAWRDGEGYYWFVGRSDDVIKCSGYRIGPFEVESALLTHPSVLECAVTAAPDPIRGQVVKATIVLARGYSPSDELKKELQNHVKHTTAPYKYPRVVEFVEELPKTSSGKIRRVQIRQADAAGK